MEFLHGDLKKEFIKSEKTHSFETIMDVFTQIIKQLKIFHDANLLHNDIKPENIMYIKKGTKYRVYLQDFDFVKKYKDEKDIQGFTCKYVDFDYNLKP